MDTALPPVLIVAAGATKGHARERAVPLSGFVITELHRARMPASGWVFRRMDGRAGPCTPGLISHYANIHLHECGIDATLHSLRHRYGTQIYRGTRDLRLTQDLLGHSSPVVTAGYAAYDRPSAHAAVDALPVPERLRSVGWGGDHGARTARMKPPYSYQNPPAVTTAMATVHSLISLPRIDPIQCRCSGKARREFPAIRCSAGPSCLRTMGRERARMP